MKDIDHIGGIPVVMKTLLDAGLLHGDCLTVTGKTMAENLEEINPPHIDGRVIREMDRADPPDRRPDDPHRLAGPRGRGREVGRLRRVGLRGHGPRLRRRARGHGRRREGLARRRTTSSSSATRVPRAARACARCSPSPARSRAPGSARTSCCSPTAASPAARPACASGTSPRRPSTTGPIAFVHDGDPIRLDVANGALDLLVDEDEMQRRRAEGVTHPEPKYTRGVLAKYRKLVGSASRRRRLRLNHPAYQPVSTG